MQDACDVAIVGAGISGLTAAYMLRDLDVVVLEAEDRVGGRSQRTQLAGWPTTSGAEGWYDPNPASPESRFLAEVGIKMRPVGKPGRLHAGGTTLGLPSPGDLAAALNLSAAAKADLLRAFGRIREACAVLTRTPVDTAAISELLSVSATDWLQPVHEEVLTAFRRLASVEMGTYLEAVSAFQFLYGMPEFGGATDTWMDFLVPEGGAPMISVALADALRRPPVTSALVTRIDNDEAGATVSWRDHEGRRSLAAKYVVAATPSPVTREIISQLSADKLAGMAKLTPGPIVEVSLLLADGGPASWDDLGAMWTIDKAFSVCLHSKTDLDNRVGDGGADKHSVIKMIAVGASAAMVVDRSDEWIARVFSDDFIEIFPEAAGKAKAHAVRRYVHGTPLATLGYEEYVAQLIAPEGRVHFAGDWAGFVDPANPGGLGVDGDWGGYAVTAGLNSAVRAGMRAAAEIRERFTAQNP